MYDAGATNPGYYHLPNKDKLHYCEDGWTTIMARGAMNHNNTYDASFSERVRTSHADGIYFYDGVDPYLSDVPPSNFLMDFDDLNT